MKDFLNFLLVVCQRRKKEKAAEYKKILEFDFKVTKNKVFLEIIILLNNFFLEKNNINIDNNKLDS